MKQLNGDDLVVGLAGGMYTSALTATGGFWAVMGNPSILGPVLVAIIMGFFGLLTTVVGILVRGWYEERQRRKAEREEFERRQEGKENE